MFKRTLSAIASCPSLELNADYLDFGNCSVGKYKQLSVAVKSDGIVEVSMYDGCCVVVV